MNTNYAKYSITARHEKVAEADWYYVQPEVAVERGDVFTGFGLVTLPAEGTLSLSMLTPLDLDVYLIGVGVNGPSTRMTEKIFEGAVVTGGTGTLPIINTNRQSTVQPAFTVQTGVTVVSQGTLIDEVEKFEAKKTSAAAEVTGRIRLLFKRNTQYVLQLTNGDNQQNPAYVKFYILQR